MWVNQLQQTLEQGVRAMQQGQLQAAEQAFTQILKVAPKEPNTLHFMALVRKQQGDAVGAEAYFEKALLQGRDQPQIWSNYGNFLRELGRQTAAITAYKEALNLNPALVDVLSGLATAYRVNGDFQEAWDALEKAENLAPSDAKIQIAKGLVHRDQDRLEDALDCYDKAIELDRDSFVAWHNKGVALRMLLRPEEAIDCYARIAQQGIRVPEFRFNNACALYDAGRTEEADEELRVAIGLDPANLMAHEALNKLYWEHGMTDNFGRSYEVSIETRPQDRDLRAAYAGQLHKAGQEGKALDIITQAEKELGEYHQFHHFLGVLDGLDQKLDKGIARLEKAIDLFPESARYRIDIANFLIRHEEYKTAMVHLEEAEKYSPLDQEMWAYKGLVWRLTEDEREHWLNDYDRFVRPFRLPTPEGYDDLEHFMSELKIYLAAMHRTERQPLDQSVRGGTQTSNFLLGIQDKVIKDYRWALEECVREYLSSLPDDPRHPFLSRKGEDFYFSGSWSVRLKAEGFHVNHIHPEGWLSGPTYIDVPAEMSPDDPMRRGWVKFGETSLKLGEDKEHVAKAVCPEPGMCVFFPSYIWHGTYPFESDSYRMTTPCDIMPRARKPG